MARIDAYGLLAGVDARPFEAQADIAQAQAAIAETNDARRRKAENPDLTDVDQRLTSPLLLTSITLFITTLTRLALDWIFIATTDLLHKALFVLRHNAGLIPLRFTK